MNTEAERGKRECGPMEKGFIRDLKGLKAPLTVAVLRWFMGPSSSSKSQA